METINAVFEGGGVRGIGHVGAIQVTEEQFKKQAPQLYGNLAGTSAGAVIASLLACGYNGNELETVMRTADYTKFADEDWIQSIPWLGTLAGILFEKGMHKGDYLLQWLREHYAAKRAAGAQDFTFGELKKPDGSYRLQVIASDISRGEMLVLPRDFEAYDYPGHHYTPDTLPVALAVRMSSSIPFFFDPIKVTYRSTGKTSYIVDGGMLSDYPLEIVNRDHECTLGYRLVGPNEGKPNDITGPIEMVAALISTMVTAHDNLYIEDQKFRNTIAIETFGTIEGETRDIDGTDFGIGKLDMDMLYNNGRKAASDFFGKWDMNACGPVAPATTAESRHDRLFAHS